MNKHRQLTMDSIRTYLNRFLNLTNEEWDDLAICLKKKIVENKKQILKKGDKCEFLAFIEKGLFRFYYLEDGEETNTAFFFSGDFISNYRSFLTDNPSEHYIESMQNSVIYKISKKDLNLLYDKHKSLERLGRLIAENLYLGVADRLDSFMFDTPKQRYEGLIKRNSKLLQEIPQYMLASYLGVKPQSLSRIRARK